MRPLLRVLPVAAVSLVCLVMPARGQQPLAGPRLEAIWEAYQQLDYAQAADSARAALEVHERYSRNELAEIHTILGLIDFSQNQPQEARGQFTAALSLNPDLELDSLLVSPKILTFFDEVRDEMRQSRPAEAENAVPVRYVVVEDKRSEAALRSMVLPGWGQLHKGEQVKGRVLLGVWGALVAGTATTHLLREQARQEYEAAATPDEAFDRYGPYNRWHKARNALLMGAVGIWIYSYVDALTAAGPSRGRRSLSVTPAFADRQVSVLLRLRW